MEDIGGRGARLRDRLAALPGWIRTLIGLPVAVGLVAATLVTVSGSLHHADSAWVGGSVVLILSLWRDRGWWRMGGRRRHAVHDVVRTAAPSGDRRVDDLALDRLRTLVQAGPRPPSDLVMAAAFITGPPIGAAVRTGNLWWLMLLTAGPLLLLPRLRPAGFDPFANFELLLERTRYFPYPSAD